VIRLRDHHLFCVTAFAGRGYSPALIETLTQVTDRIAGGEAIQIHSGRDDICAPLATNPRAHCHRPEITARDRQALRDARLRLGESLRIGSVLRLGKSMPWFEVVCARAFRHGGLAPACRGCQWAKFCNDVVAGRTSAPRLGV
jgi:hypothetical protein